MAKVAPARIPSLGTNPPFGAISAIKIAHFWTHADLKWYLERAKMGLNNVVPCIGV